MSRRSFVLFALIALVGAFVIAGWNAASGYTDAYYFDYLKGEYEFEIATFDVDGLYSRFVSIHPAQ